MKTMFDSISSATTIFELIGNSASEDGENASFELKGTKGRKIPTREDKVRFAKELCAFANTYGGVLCIHKGGKTNTQPFETDEAIHLFNCLESWSRDSVEPRCPMQIKVVDGFLLIGVTESVTKPHRSTRDQHYYYRHETQSEKMPEIMIGSLYRGQAVLATTSSVGLMKMGDGLHILAEVKNQSRVAGTSPRMQVNLYSTGGALTFAGPNLDPLPEFRSPFLGVDWIKWNGGMSTNVAFQGHVLYPEDTLNLQTIAHTHSKSADKVLPRHFIAQIDTMFLQAARQVSYLLLDLEHTDENGAIGTKILQRSGRSNLQTLVQEFIRLNNRTQSTSTLGTNDNVRTRSN